MSNKPVKFDSSPIARLEGFMKQKAITKENQADDAAQAYLAAHAAYKQVEEQRTTITKKMLEAKRAVDAQADQVRKPLEKIIAHIGGLLESWEMKQRVRATTTVEKAAAKETDLARRQDMLNHAEDEPGWSAKGLRWTADYDIYVLDLAEVPIEYLMLDTKKVKKVLKAGVSVPGISVAKKFKVGRSGTHHG